MMEIHRYFQGGPIHGLCSWNLIHVSRDVEIVKFCTCPQKILLVQNNKLAYTLQCLNNLFVQKQYETRYISTLVSSMDPDQLASLVNSVDPDQLASEEAS